MLSIALGHIGVRSSAAVVEFGLAIRAASQLAGASSVLGAALGHVGTGSGVIATRSAVLAFLLSQCQPSSLVDLVNRLPGSDSCRNNTIGH